MSVTSASFDPASAEAQWQRDAFSFRMRFSIMRRFVALVYMSDQDAVFVVLVAGDYVRVAGTPERRGEQLSVIR